MKQKFRRLYGMVIAITLVSGITGAFAYSWADRTFNSQEKAEAKIHFSDGIFNESL